MPPSGTDVVKALQQAGFRMVGQVGSHVKLRLESAGQVRTVIVPLHAELAPGTLASIGRQSGMSKHDIESHI